MRERGELGAISHELFRFNEPACSEHPFRQRADFVEGRSRRRGAAQSGIDGFDVFGYITGEEPKVVAAVTSHTLHHREVEDDAHVYALHVSGIVCLNEASYTI